MSSLLLEQDLAEKIHTHAIARIDFQAWESFQRCVYDLVSSYMDPEMEHFWGFCAKTGCFFISDAVPESLRIAILQMEQYRTIKKKTHAEAVAFALAQFQRNKKILALALLPFYQKLALSFADGEKTKDAGDVTATVHFLAEYQ